MKFRCIRCDLFYYFYWTLYLVIDNNHKDLRKNLICTALKIIEVYDLESNSEKKLEIEKDINTILNIAYKY